jgi:hypothetical protein
MNTADAVTGGPAAGPSLKRSLTYWDLVLYGLAYIAPFAPLRFVWNESNGTYGMREQAPESM